MAIQGLRTTANFITNQRPTNYREGIMLLYPNGKTPLTAMSTLMKSDSTDDPRCGWFEKALDSRRFALHATSGDLTTTNTSIVLAATAKGLSLKEGDLLRVEQTGEVMLVTTDPSSNTTLTVQRGFAGTTATAVDANGAGVNPNLQLIGSAYEEGSPAPTGIAFDPTEKYTYTQIFRNTLEATRTAAKTRLRTGDAVKEAKRECLEYHMIDIERAAFFGIRHETARKGKPLRLTDGIYNVLARDAANNVVDVAAEQASGCDMEAFEEYCYEIFQYGSDEKLAFVGNRSLLTINQIIRKNTAYQMVGGITEYKMNVQRLITPFGELVLKRHRLFNQSVGGTTGGTAYHGQESHVVVMDMENVKYRYFTGDDTRYQKDLQDNGVDGMQSGYLTECAFEFHHPETHYIMKNLIAAKVDD